MRKFARSSVVALLVLLALCGICGARQEPWGPCEHSAGWSWTLPVCRHEVPELAALVGIVSAKDVLDAKRTKRLIDLHHFGQSVAVDGDTLLLGSPATAVDGMLKGAVFILGNTPETFELRTRLTWPAIRGGNANYAKFGHSVAMHSERIAVGAPDWDFKRGATAVGSVFVFQFEDDEWKASQRIRQAEPESWDHFGSSVAIHGDWIVVGSPASGPAGERCGSVFTYLHDGELWRLRQELRPSRAAETDRFGDKLAFDGKTLLVSSSGGVQRADDVGELYFFDLTEQGFVQRAVLDVSTPAEEDPPTLHAVRSIWLDGASATIGVFDQKNGPALIEYERVETEWRRKGELQVWPGTVDSK